MLSVLYINSTGAGYATRVSVEDGTTLDQFLRSQDPERNPNVGSEEPEYDEDGNPVENDKPAFDPAQYTITVNRQIEANDYVLQNGDRVTVVFAKIEGA